MGFLDWVFNHDGLMYIVLVSLVIGILLLPVDERPRRF